MTPSDTITTTKQNANSNDGDEDKNDDDDDNDTDTDGHADDVDVSHFSRRYGSCNWFMRCESQGVCIAFVVW